MASPYEVEHDSQSSSYTPAPLSVMQTQVVLEQALVQPSSYQVTMSTVTILAKPTLDFGRSEN
jgi:hypothetical protein